MASALLRCIRCTKATDAAVRKQDEDSEMRPFTGEDENEEEPGEVWENWRRVLVAALLLVMSFFVACAYSLLGCFFPIEAAEKGSTSITTAVIIGVSPLCLATLSPIIGYYIECLAQYQPHLALFNVFLFAIKTQLPELGTKLVLISGQALVGGTFILMGSLAYMPSAVSFVVYGILLRVTEGVGWAMSSTTTFALIPVLFPSRVGTLTGLIMGSIGLGFTAGPPIGSLLVIAAGYSTPFWIVGGMILCLAPMSFLLVKETSTSSKVLPFKTLIKLLSRLSFFMISISDMVAYGSLTFQDTALSIYLFNEVGLSLLETGIYYGAMSVSHVVISFLGGSLSDKLGPRKLIITGLFIDGASLMLLGLNGLFPPPRRWTIIIALVLLGGGAGLADVPTYSDFLQQAKKQYPNENKESVVTAVSGITAFSQAIGEFLGAILGGFLTYFTDFPTAVLMFGEAIAIHGFLVLGVSLIDHLLIFKQPPQ